MKQSKILKVISIICSIIGLILASFGLIIGLKSIGAPGWDALGVIFIMPSLISFIVILFDFLITLNKFKNGLTYSCINSIIKVLIIIYFIQNAISDYNYEMKYGVSNFKFDIIVIILLTIVTVPSILNTIKLIKSK